VPVDAQDDPLRLGAVKGTGEQAVNVILKARAEGGPFKDLFDFCLRVDKRMVNRRTIEALIRAGAFDSLDDHRARLIASVGIAMEAAEQAERNAMQVSLFDVFDSTTTGRARSAVLRSAALDRAAEADRGENRARLLLLRAPVLRSQARGLALRAPSRSRRSSRARSRSCLPDWLSPCAPRSPRAARWRFVQLDDGTSQLEVSVFNETFEAERDKIKEDEVLIVEGKVQKDDFAGEGKIRVVAERLLTLADARGRFARHLRLSLNGQASGANAQGAALRLQSILAPYIPGNCPVRLTYRNKEAVCELNLGDTSRVRLEDDLLLSLSDWLSSEAVEIRYQ
jgi:DNA polymerase-3 subunit alpha